MARGGCWRLGIDGRGARRAGGRVPWQEAAGQAKTRGVSGATYDTGMLIALDRRKARARAIHEWLSESRVRVTVPWAVVAEFWRGRTDRRDAILRSVDIEVPSLALAKTAGLALGKVP